MSAAALGQIIGGKYRIIRLLGSGGMGAVYEAINPEIQQRVALKVLTVDVTAQPGLGQRFLNEARAANQINHPGVAKVHDFGILETGITPWMAVEYLEGESLASRMEAALRLPGNRLGIDSFWMIGEMASILDAAHKKKIVHRDIKPANTMLVPDPRSMHGEHVKLLDFGIAKIAPDSLLTADSLTKSGSLLGTPVYMAPEQFRAAGDVDGKADIYALGIIAYSILSGRLPFDVKGTYEMMAAKCFDVPTPIAKYAPQLPPEMQAFVMRMLERDPAVRPTASEVEAEVRRTLGLPVPRQTGGHNIPVAPPPPNPAPVGPQVNTNNTTMDGPDETPDLTSKASAAVEAALGPTPSEQRAVGQLEPSPRGVNVPISLSSMPSVPMTFTPPQRPTPREGAAEGAQVVRAAARSSPTQRGAFRRPLLVGLGAVVALSGAIGATVALWPPQKPMQPSTNNVQPTPPTEPSAIGTTPPAVPPPPPVVTAPAQPPVATLPSAPLTPATSPGQGPTAPGDPKGGRKTPAGGKSAPRAPEPQFPVEACIITNMAKPQRDRLLGVFKSSGVKLPPGERFVLGGLRDYPKIITAPPSFNVDSSTVYDLLGRLADADLPGQVELRCRK